MSTRIRRAHIGDQARFLELWREYLTSDGREVLPTEANLAIIGRYFGAVCRDGKGVCLLVEDDGELVGGLLWVHGDQGFDLSFTPHATGLGTYLKTDYRRLGLGETMWRRAEEALYLQGIRTIIIGPHSDNTASLSGMEKMGYKPHQTLVRKDL